MSINVNIDDIVNFRGVKPEHIIFRADYNPVLTVHSVCALANDIDNAGGGYLIIGIEEKGGAPVLPAKGIRKERIEAIETKLLEHCRVIKPDYQPEVDHFLYQGVYVIAVRVKTGARRPYKAPENILFANSPMCCYIRSSCSDIIASADEERELFHTSFDDKAAAGASLSDLDEGLMCGYLNETGSSLFEASLSMDAADLADAMRLTVSGGGLTSPSNTGILMFTEDPSEYFRHSTIDVVEKPDPTGIGLKEKSFGGPIQEQLRNALAYIEENHIRCIGEADGVKKFNYPYKAVEEILVNAVLHRSYQIDEPITVVITPEAIEITSLPGFDRCITDADIADRNIRGIKLRNRRIAEAFKELGLAKGRNTGIPSALNAMQENGSPNIVFRMNPERDYLTVILPVCLVDTADDPADIPADAETGEAEAVETQTEAVIEENDGDINDADMLDGTADNGLDDIQDSFAEAEIEDETADDIAEPETDEIPDDNAPVDFAEADYYADEDDIVIEETSDEEIEIIPAEATEITEAVHEEEAEEVSPAEEEPSFAVTRYAPPEDIIAEADDEPDEITAESSDVEIIPDEDYSDAYTADVAAEDFAEVIEAEEVVEAAVEAAAEAVEEAAEAAEEKVEETAEATEESIEKKPAKKKTSTADKKPKPAKADSKQLTYEKGITDLLRDNPLTLTELSKAIGYKGITGKLSKTVDAMVTDSKLKRTVYPDGSTKLEII